MTDKSPHGKGVGAVLLATLAVGVIAGTAFFNGGGNQGQVAGPADYSSAPTEEGGTDGSSDDLAHAFNILETLESRSLQDPETQDDLARLEEIYNTSRTRKTKITNLRAAKITQLNQVMGSAGLSSLQKEGIRDTKSARRDEFEGEITAALSGLNLTGEQITDITDRARTIHLLTNDLRLIDRFITHYNQIKVSFCSTNDEQNDIYTRGTVTLVHNNSKQYDTCSADKTKVVQNVCTGVRLDANSPSETDCSYGCDKGACKKGAINGTKWVNSDTNPVEFANGVVHANVDFYLEVDTSAVQPDTNEVITFGWKAKYNQGNGCNYGGADGAISELSVPVQAGDNVKTYIGPFNCPKATGRWSVPMDLKHGDALTARVTNTGQVGATTIDGINLVMPATATVGQPVTATLQAFGSNGLPYDRYAYGLQFLVTATDNAPEGDGIFLEEGDESVDFPLGIVRINASANQRNTELVLTDEFTFRRAGTFTVTALNQYHESKVTITVTE